MTKAQQVALGTTLAGVNQYKVFSAVMTNFNTAIKANEEALQSDGSALKENEKYMESIQARIQAVKNELQEMILKSDLDKLIKKFLELSQTVLKFQNSIGGLKPLLVAISGILLAINWDKIVVGIGRFGYSIVSGIQSLKNFNTTLSTTQITAEGVSVAIGGVTLAITALIAVFNLLNNIEKENDEKLNELINSTNDYFKDTNKVLVSLKDEKISRETLNSIIENNFDAYDAEALKLMNVNDAREKAIELLEKERKQRANQLTETGQSEYEKAKSQLNNVGLNATNFDIADISTYVKINALLPNNSDFKKVKSGLNLQAMGYKEYRDAISEAIKEEEEHKRSLVEQGKSVVFSEKKLKKYREALSLVDNQIEEKESLIKNYENTLKSIGQAYDYDKKEVISLQEAIQKENGNNTFINSLNDDLNAIKENFNLTEEQISQIKDSLFEKIANGDEEADAFSVFSELFPELINNVEEADNELESLSETINATSEEIERAENFLSQIGLKEKELEKEIGMTSVELLRQADAWNMDGEALYNYLKALNIFDESMDSIQSSYQTLQTAIDEYNETNGFSIDTTQALLRMSPEYLEMLDEAISGHKSLKDSITEKIKAQALEAKQTIYNIAIDRINKLSSEESKEANNNLANSFGSSTEDIDKQTSALEANSQAKIKNAIASAHQRKVTDKQINEILDDMNRQLDAVDKMVLSVGTDFSKAMGNSSNSTNGTNSALKEQNNLLKEQKQLLEEKKKQYDTVVSYIKKKIQGEIDKLKDEKKAQVDAIKDQIDALKDLKDAESDAIDEQIDKLKEQKEIEEEYWSEKIEAFKKQNEELEEQLEYEELLENLAKAKSKRVRVYKEGQGFVYTEDTNEIDKAQTKIDEYTRKKEYNDQLELLESYKENAKKNYEQQIDDLEKLKKEKEKNYDEQIKALEQQQKAVEDSYDAQIAYYQTYLDKFTEETDAYENQQNRLLALQLTGIDFEAQGWQTRLDNLASFVEKYNALLGDIHTLDADGNTGTVTVNTAGTGGNGGNQGDGGTVQTQTTADKLKANSELYKVNNINLAQQIADKNKKTYVASKAGMDSNAVESYEQTANWYAKNYGGKKASGDAFINKDGAYLVGENPNQELIIGSKLNGSLVNLSRGSGVVNSTSTNTLAGILNQLGAMSQNGINMSNSQTRNTNISIGNISLPNVSNGKDFVDYLQNFSLQMTQEAFV